MSDEEDEFVECTLDNFLENSNLLDEKDAEIDHLKERIATLEKYAPISVKVEKTRQTRQVIRKVVSKQFEIFVGVLPTIFLVVAKSGNLYEALRLTLSKGRFVPLEYFSYTKNKLEQVPRELVIQLRSQHEIRHLPTLFPTVTISELFTTSRADWKKLSAEDQSDTIGDVVEQVKSYARDKNLPTPVDVGTYFHGQYKSARGNGIMLVFETARASKQWKELEGEVAIKEIPCKYKQVRRRRKTEQYYGVSLLSLPRRKVALDLINEEVDMGYPLTLYQGRTTVVMVPIENPEEENEMVEASAVFKNELCVKVSNVPMEVSGEDIKTWFLDTLPLQVYSVGKVEEGTTTLSWLLQLEDKPIDLDTKRLAQIVKDKMAATYNVVSPTLDVRHLRVPESGGYAYRCWVEVRKMLEMERSKVHLLECTREGGYESVVVEFADGVTVSGHQATRSGFRFVSQLFRVSGSSPLMRLFDVWGGENVVLKPNTIFLMKTAATHENLQEIKENLRIDGPLEWANLSLLRYRQATKQVLMNRSYGVRSVDRESDMYHILRRPTLWLFSGDCKTAREYNGSYQCCACCFVPYQEMGSLIYYSHDHSCRGRTPSSVLRWFKLLKEAIALLVGKAVHDPTWGKSIRSMETRPHLERELEIAKKELERDDNLKVARDHVLAVLKGCQNVEEILAALGGSDVAFGSHKNVISISRFNKLLVFLKAMHKNVNQVPIDYIHNEDTMYEVLTLIVPFVLHTLQNFGKKVLTVAQELAKCSWIDDIARDAKQREDIFKEKKMSVSNDESYERNFHNCTCIRMLFSRVDYMFDNIFGWRPRMFVRSTAIVMQVAYSRERPTMQSLLNMYIHSAFSWISLGYYDLLVNTRKGCVETTKPMIVANHPHAWVEEIPLFMAKYGECVLPVIEEDWEASQKTTKAAGSRSLRNSTEFKTDKATQESIAWNVLDRTLPQRGNEVNGFGVVELKDLQIHWCAFSILPEFATTVRGTTYKVIPSRWAYGRLLGVLNRLLVKPIVHHEERTAPPENKFVKLHSYRSATRTEPFKSIGKGPLQDEEAAQQYIKVMVPWEQRREAWYAAQEDKKTPTCPWVLEKEVREFTARQMLALAGKTLERRPLVYVEEMQRWEVGRWPGEANMCSCRYTCKCRGCREFAGKVSTPNTRAEVEEHCKCDAYATLREVPCECVTMPIVLAKCGQNGKVDCLRWCTQGVPLDVREIRTTHREETLPEFLETTALLECRRYRATAKLKETITRWKTLRRTSSPIITKVVEVSDSNGWLCIHIHGEKLLGVGGSETYPPKVLVTTEAVEHERGTYEVDVGLSTSTMLVAHIANHEGTQIKVVIPMLLRAVGSWVEGEKDAIYLVSNGSSVGSKIPTITHLEPTRIGTKGGEILHIHGHHLCGPPEREKHLRVSIRPTSYFKVQKPFEPNHITVRTLESLQGATPPFYLKLCSSTGQTQRELQYLPPRITTCKRSDVDCLCCNDKKPHRTGKVLPGECRVIKGENLGQDPAHIEVTLGDYSVKVERFVKKHEELLIKMPSGVGGPHRLQVSVYGQEGRSEVDLWFAKPSIHGIEPSGGCVDDYFSITVDPIAAQDVAHVKVRMGQLEVPRDRVTVQGVRNNNIVVLVPERGTTESVVEVNVTIRGQQCRKNPNHCKFKYQRVGRTRFLRPTDRTNVRGKKARK